MTNIKIVKKNELIIEVEATGHTGYSVAGEDIVCAALSSIIQTAALGILGVAGIKAIVSRKDEDGYFKIVLPLDMTKEQKHDAKIILDTMLSGVSDLWQGYSNFIKLEVLEDVY